MPRVSVDGSFWGRRVTNFVLRIFVFVLGIPALGALIFLLPNANHLAFNVLVIVVGAGSAFEVARFFPAQETSYPLSRLVLPVFGGLLPLIVLLELFALVPTETVDWAVTGLVALSMAFQVFRRKAKEFPDIVPRVSAHLLVALYPGLFLTYIVRLTAFTAASTVIAAFVLACYLNDTAAYVVGILFGKKSIHPVPVSPNKSLIGFVGGLVLSPTVIVVAKALDPRAFPGTYLSAVLFGLVVGVAVILGDLVESALKRGVTLKDSGGIIPGRGGLLDSIDSPVFAAPVFYLGYKLLFIGA